VLHHDSIYLLSIFFATKAFVLSSHFLRVPSKSENSSRAIWTGCDVCRWWRRTARSGSTWPTCALSARTLSMESPNFIRESSGIQCELSALTLHVSDSNLRSLATFKGSWTILGGVASRCFMHTVVLHLVYSSYRWGSLGYSGLLWWVAVQQRLETNCFRCNGSELSATSRCDRCVDFNCIWYKLTVAVKQQIQRTNNALVLRTRSVQSLFYVACVWKTRILRSRVWEVI